MKVLGKIKGMKKVLAAVLVMVLALSNLSALAAPSAREYTVTFVHDHAEEYSGGADQYYERYRSHYSGLSANDFYKEVSVTSGDTISARNLPSTNNFTAATSFNGSSNTSYKFVGWVLDGVTYTTAELLRLPITSDVTVVADFQPINASVATYVWDVDYEGFFTRTDIQVIDSGVINNDADFELLNASSTISYLEEYTSGGYETAEGWLNGRVFVSGVYTGYGYITISGHYGIETFVFKITDDTPDKHGLTFRYVAESGSNFGTLISEVEYVWNGSTIANTADATIPNVNGYTSNSSLSTYTFMGWSQDTDRDGSGDGPVLSSATIASYTITGPAVYVAVYKETSAHTVAFNSNGGTAINDQYVADGSTATEPTEPTKTGYTFEGWYSDADLTTEYDFAAPVRRNVTVYAKWSINSYDITFQDEDGSLISTQSYTHGANVTVPANPTKAATAQYTYTFTGWSPTVSETATGNATYTATYSSAVNSYTVTFLNEDGTILSSVDYNYGATVIEPATPTKTPTAENTYIFAGWDSEVTTVTGEATYTATYSEVVNSYVVSYTDGVEDETITVPGSSDYAYNSVVTVLNDKPVRTGYTFTGWEYDGETYDGGDTFTMPAKNVTLTATWEVNEYIVLYSDGVEDESITVPWGSRYDYDSEVKVSDFVPERAGYTFEGWVTESVDVVDGTFTMPASTVIFTATWEAIEYTVEFVDEDGTELLEKIYYYGDMVTEPAAPTKEDADGYTYAFAGWSPEVTAVTEDVVYTATYLSARIETPEVDDAYDVETGAYSGEYDAHSHDVIYGLLVADGNGNEVDAIATYVITDADGNELAFVDEDGNGIPEVMDADTYSVVVTVVVGDIEMELEVAVVVTAAPLTITVDNATKVEGEVDPVITAIIEGLQGEDAMDYTVSREVGEAVGTYVATATYTEDLNYEVTVVDGSLTITAAPVVDEPTDVPSEDEPEEDDADTTIVITPAGTTTDGFADVSGDDADEDTTEIEDEDVPLVDAPEEDKTEIEEQEVPLASALDESGWALMNLILAIGTAAGSAILLIGYFMNKRVKEDEEVEEASVRNNKGIFRALSLIPALGSILLFALTQNMLDAMVMVDKWTLAMAVIALVQVVVAVASRKKDEEVQEEEELFI